MKTNSLLQKAKQHCESHRYRWTEPRQQVLRALAKQRRPVGAYDIIKLLSSDQKTVNAPTVYRAIEFWQEQGFVHRIDSSNTFITCSNHHCNGNFFILICQACSAVTEIAAKNITQLVNRCSQQAKFAVSKINLEVHGLCQQCKENN
tara:strand:+ start:276 stop:716 length:441 start_codon:yes stop_codon:yes gene_type:complete